MRIRVGTSGWSYKEWKGHFYPEKLAAKDMLHYYAERFPTVEVNNTFYRMPNPATLESWSAEVPSDFAFVLKASKRITHDKRLKEVGDSVAVLGGPGPRPDLGRSLRVLQARGSGDRPQARREIHGGLRGTLVSPLRAQIRSSAPTGRSSGDCKSYPVLQRREDRVRSIVIKVRNGSKVRPRGPWPA